MFDIFFTMNKNDHHLWFRDWLFGWEFCILHTLEFDAEPHSGPHTQTVAALERFRSASSVQAKCPAALWLRKYKNLDQHRFWAVIHFIHCHEKMDWRTPSRFLLDIPSSSCSKMRHDAPMDLAALMSTPCGSKPTIQESAAGPWGSRGGSIAVIDGQTWPDKDDEGHESLDPSQSLRFGDQKGWNS